jgi:hypothetical protein
LFCDIDTPDPMEKDVPPVSVSAAFTVIWELLENASEPVASYVNDDIVCEQLSVPSCVIVAAEMLGVAPEEMPASQY